MNRRVGSGGWRRLTAVLTALVLSGLLLVPVALAVDTVAPNPPTSLQVVFPGTGVRLNWQSSTSGDVTSYRVYRSQGSGSPVISEFTFLAETNLASHLDTLVNGGDYSYAVVAVDAAGNRSQPATISLMGEGGDRVAPGAPTNLHAGWSPSGQNRIDLTWTAPAGTDIWRYLVFRAEGSGSSAFLAYVDAAHGFYVDQRATGPLYAYKVFAQDRSGNVSPASSEVSVTSDAVSPVVRITSPVAYRSDRPVIYQRTGLLPVTFSVVETGSGYDPEKIELYLDDHKTGPAINLASLAEGSHELKVRVTDRAENAGEERISFWVSSSEAGAAPRISTPSGFTNANSITLSWSAVTGASNYQVYQVAADGTESLFGATYQTSLGLAVQEGLWTFRVRANTGSLSDASTTVAFLVDRTAPAVTITSPENGKTYNSTASLPVTYQVTDGVYGHDATTVTMRLDNGTFGTSVSLSGLVNGEHRLEVKAVDRAGNERISAARFVVNRTGSVDDDDDEDDDDDDDSGNGKDRIFMPDLSFTVTAQQKADILAALSRGVTSAQKKRTRSLGLYWIQQGHLKSLQAKAEAGAWRSFVFHLYKHRGKFIDGDLAEDLLEILHADHLNIDARAIPDSEIEGWENGPPTNKGRSKKD